MAKTKPLTDEEINILMLCNQITLCYDNGKIEDMRKFINLLKQN